MRKFLLFIVLACAACARTEPPAPVSHYGVHTRESFAALVRTVTPEPESARQRPAPVLAAPRAVPGRPMPVAKIARIAPAAPPKFVLAPPAAVKGFIWPVRGQVISGYGPKAGGLYNDGINIAAPRNTPVAAAADGVVAYVGSGIESYGNLVLVRHGGGVVTAYAHLSDVKVKQGMPVKKGQSIGAVGSTGAVATSQLHFEIRRGGDAVDPKKFLG